MSYKNHSVKYTTVADGNVIDGRLDAAMAWCAARSLERDGQRRCLTRYPADEGIYILSSDSPPTRPPKNPTDDNASC